MNAAAKALAQLKKANKLVQLSFRKNGPKSFKRGQGRLLNSLLENDGKASRDDLVWMLGVDRSELKGIVKKASRNGYATMVKGAEHSYDVELTATGRELATRRAEANDAAASDILACLSEEEIAQLNALTEKIILAAKEKDICGKKKGYRSEHGCCHA